MSPRATQLSISTSAQSSAQAETREGAGQQKGKCLQLRSKISVPTAHQVGGISPQSGSSLGASQSDDAGHSQQTCLQSDSRALIE